MRTSESDPSPAGSEASYGGIAPEDSFLVQIRGGSRLAEQAVSGRVEHLHSGRSEPFASLSELLDFVGQYFGRIGSGPAEPDQTNHCRIRSREEVSE